MTGSARVVVTTPADTQILITREFSAPRHLVFRAWTTPELIARWWTGGRGEATVTELDLRPGGAWRRVIVLPDGTEAAFHGEYREIVPGELLVYTEVFEARPGAEALNTVTFTDRDSRTVVSLLVEYADRADRDAHLGYALAGGLEEAMDTLERLALSLRAGQASRD